MRNDEIGDIAYQLLAKKFLAETRSSKLMDIASWRRRNAMCKTGLGASVRATRHRKLEALLLLYRYSIFLMPHELSTDLATDALEKAFTKVFAIAFDYPDEIIDECIQDAEGDELLVQTQLYDSLLRQPQSIPMTSGEAFAVVLLISMRRRWALPKLGGEDEGGGGGGAADRGEVSSDLCPVAGLSFDA